MRILVWLSTHQYVGISWPVACMRFFKFPGVGPTSLPPPQFVSVFFKPSTEHWSCKPSPFPHLFNTDFDLVSWRIVFNMFRTLQKFLFYVCVGKYSFLLPWHFIIFAIANILINHLINLLQIVYLLFFRGTCKVFFFLVLGEGG